MTGLFLRSGPASLIGRRDQLEAEQLSGVPSANGGDGLLRQGGGQYQVKRFSLVAEGVVAAEADPIRAEQLDRELECPRRAGDRVGVKPGQVVTRSQSFG